MTANLPAQLLHHLDQIDNETLRSAILQEVNQLNKKFGLVFERHMPEGVRLPGHKITRGSKVAITHRAGKAVKDPNFYSVRTIDRENGTALLIPTTGEPFMHPLDEIMVAKEFGDITYPGMKVIDQVRTDDRPDAPTHAIINGENHHVLEALQYTHTGKVDLIYIDPPYNTGNADWKYNDRYVDTTDGYRHSKWLSFMEKRLLLSKKLLKNTGVIFVAIDDNEHHRLRSLMDQVFGENNFLNNIVWQGGYDSRSRFASRGHDYMLIYANNLDQLSDLGKSWLEPKPGADLTIEAAKSAFNLAKEDAVEATQRLRAWFKRQAKNSDANKHGNYNYNNVDDEGRAYYRVDLSCPAAGTPYWYDVFHPTTGKPCRKPSRGWGHSPSRMESDLKQGLIDFGVDDTTLPYFKKFLDESMLQVPRTVFEKDRRSATQSLAKVLGSARFPYPKDFEVLMRWIRMAAPKDAVVLDFFGGSGTTAEAVMRLNAEDGGTRQAILVTNNELSKQDDAKLRKAGHKPGDAEYEKLGVFHHVTKQRLEIVATGEREDGSTYENTVPGNLNFMELKYLEESDIYRGRALDDLAGLFWMKAGAVGSAPEITTEDTRRGYALSDHMAILLKTSAARELKSQVSTNGIDLKALFVVTDSDAQGDEAAKLFIGTPVIERMYGPYLEAFQINRG